MKAYEIRNVTTGDVLERADAEDPHELLETMTEGKRESMIYGGKLLGGHGFLAARIGDLVALAVEDLEMVELMKVLDGGLLKEIAVKAHQTGYFRVEVTPDHEIVTYDDLDVNDFRMHNRVLLSVGTGSYRCNCDACLAGDDPADWAADDGNDLESYMEQLHEAIADRR